MNLKDIQIARERIAPFIFNSPCTHSITLSELTGSKVYCKLENLQMTGAFKERGALNKLLTLDSSARAKGVICASAGNHAQGVSYHAKRLGIKATVVMPEGTPLIKVSSVKWLGGEVILYGSSYDEAYERSVRLQQERALVPIHPFDDEEVVAGQGTIGLELLELGIPLDAVVVPIGGGGLISGIAIALKETNPRIRIIGVQAENVAGMKASIDSKKIVKLESAGTIADGIAVKKVGELTFGIVQRYVDQIVTVSEEEIANAVLLMLEIEKMMAEGAGAAPLAALINRELNLDNKNVAIIVSGGNIDVNILSRIIERGLVKDGRLLRFRVCLPDRPGSLAGLTEKIARTRANILEIHHQRAFGSMPFGEAELEITIETRGHDHIREILDFLKRANYRIQ